MTAIVAPAAAGRSRQHLHRRVLPPNRRRRYVPRVTDRSAAHSSPRAGETGFPHANCDQTRKHQQLLKEAANCGKMKSVKFAGKRLALGGEMLQDRKRGRGLAGSAAR
jgi:hypothetical protein